MAPPRRTAIPPDVPNSRSFGRRYAAPPPAFGSTSVENRLVTVPGPQWAQTGAQSSTSDGNFGNITVTGSAKVTNLAVSLSFTVQSSALQSMAFQQSTSVNITGGTVSAVQSTSALIANSSINSTPIGLSTPATGKFTDLSATGTLTLGAWTSATAIVTGYFQCLTSTGGSVKLATITT